MSIPDFQTIMLPLLELAGDGNEHRIADAITELGERFGLTVEERTELLPSGRQSRFQNRVYWAQVHLIGAELLERTQRGSFRITDRGLDVLGEKLGRIDLAFLKGFPEWVAFRAGNGQDVQVDVAPEATPSEALAAKFSELDQALAQELLERIKTNKPEFFEQLVIDLLVKMGYGGSLPDAAKAVGKSGDGGIDGVIKQDPLGLDVIYVQAKRWQGTVGGPELRNFAGSLEYRRAHKGVFLTTSRFAPDAHKFVEGIGKKIVLIDGQELARLMIKHGVGVTTAQTYEVKRIDLDYFDDQDL